MVDFSKLQRPERSPIHIDPVEIFRRTPNTGGAPNDLWKGQADALKMWHENRKQNDNIIILNTGAGKSLVGLLAAQSLINERIQNIVFICSTIDLVEQTAREADKLGMSYTIRTSKKYSNDLFETGRAFCITTYSSMFNFLSPFKRMEIGGIVFDDAHVSERLIRDSITVTVTRAKHREIYQELVEIIRPEFVALRKGDHLNFVVDDIAAGVTLCPPATAFKNSSAIINVFKKHDYRNIPEIFFPLLHLYENIKYCAIYISGREIEFCPPFIPTEHFHHVAQCNRRIYLSATLDYPTDFVRAFGQPTPNRIEPDNDAGNGERLIILASNLKEPDGKIDLATQLSATSKVLISTPSYARAASWAPVSTPPAPEEFSRALHAFRQSGAGAFCLVSRVDGIDLPQDTCRIMIIDGSPTGSNLQERYQVESLRMYSQNSTKMSTRLTQLLGRINRGRSDYGAFILYGTDINNWCKNDRNIALLPELIRKQFLLGQSLQDQVGKMSNADLIAMISSILGRPGGSGREKEWLQFYSDTIGGLEVSDEALETIRIREEKLSIGALAEGKFISALWHNDFARAREIIIPVIDDIAPVDSKLAGWYDLWLGLTYEIEGDRSSASIHYSRSRSRLTPRLNVPLISRFERDGEAVEAKNSLHRKIMEANDKGPKSIGDLASSLRNNISILCNPKKSSNIHEEACRLIGELLGFEASRPDNVFRKGPDVIWSSEEGNFLIAFELKTQKKSDDAVYKKDEIGQCLNHMEWIRENFPECEFFGINIIGPLGKITDSATPGEFLYLSSAEEFCRVVSGFVARLDDLVGRTDLERWHMISDLGNMPEFQLRGLATAICQRRMSHLV